MNLPEILKQIEPCDMQKPYIFVSYSSNDKELVWSDVLEFQRLGYNVWLDEKNLDKTKASWKEDALLAIQDIYCMLVVFYVSKSSLISEACYRELSKTTDALSVALHYGPVKFIAIDVNEIGHIGDFTKELHQSIFLNNELEKDTKSKMLLTLHQFMKDFFDSNNEKVRIHPKNEPNRKMNYYEEIIASFPDETCDLARKEATLKEKEQEEAKRLAEAEAAARAKAEEKLKAEAAARAEAEAKLKAEMAARAEAEARMKAEAEARAEAEAKAKMEAEAKAKAEAVAKAKVQAETKARADLSYLLSKDSLTKEPIDIKPAPKPATFSGTFTREQVIAAIAEANKTLTGIDKIFTVAEAGDKKIKNAIHAYAKTISSSDVTGLYDATIFGSAKEGFLFTHKAIYSSFYKNIYIDLNQVSSFQVGSKDYYLDVTYLGGKKHQFFIPTSRQNTIQTFLKAVLAQREN